MPFPSVVDVSHNRLDDPDVLEVFAAMKNLVSLLRMYTYIYLLFHLQSALTISCIDLNAWVV